MKKYLTETGAWTFALTMAVVDMGLRVCIFVIVIGIALADRVQL